MTSGSRGSRGPSYRWVPAEPGKPYLTPAEAEVVALVADGLENRDIARATGKALDTVKNHIAHAMARTGSRNRTQLALWFIRQGEPGRLESGQ